MTHYIKAGKTDALCGQRVRITHINDADPDEQYIEGMTGTITHPFAGLMIDDSSQYIAGVYLDFPSDAQRSFVGGETNLMVGDTFEIIDPSTASTFPGPATESHHVPAP